MRVCAVRNDANSGDHLWAGITCDGSLDASSNGDGAGIGGGSGISCGNIVIEGGTITATAPCARRLAFRRIVV